MIRLRTSTVCTCDEISVFGLVFFFCLELQRPLEADF